jgi:hypothetical protein
MSLLDLVNFRYERYDETPQAAAAKRQHHHHHKKHAALRSRSKEHFLQTKYVSGRE